MSSTVDLAWLIPAFFAVALVYSMAGLGGGSSYLALLALSGLPYQGLAPTALVCNLVVVSGGLYHFARAGHLSLSKVLPFLVLSIPAAFWGGTVPLEKRTFAVLLGVSLVVASLRLFLSDPSFQKVREPTWKTAWAVGLPLGAALGFWSGLVGIGGGIFLAPLLLLLGWANPKQAAAAASLFILVNSAAGLAGHGQRGLPPMDLLIPLAVVVFAGGQIGARLGSHSLPKLVLQRITAGLILVVAARLFWSLP